MLETSFLALLMAGLLGGGHCLGMCGGIVAALSAGGQGRAPWPLLLGYNTGRVASYTLVGALLGAAGALLLEHAAFTSVRVALFVVANLVIVLMGLYIAGWSGWTARIERLGIPLWRRLQPLARKLIPVRSPQQALLVGALWGWLPCGLVYSASLSALASGSASGGALAMLAFGAGTLPNLLLMGWFATRLQVWLQKPWLRRVAGLAVVASGAWPLARLLISAAH